MTILLVTLAFFTIRDGFIPLLNGLAESAAGTLAGASRRPPSGAARASARRP